MPSCRAFVLSMLVAATGLLVPATAHSATAFATSVSDENGGVTNGGVTKSGGPKSGGTKGTVSVTVPTLGYTARNDVFRAGPYRSRLDVLFNDGGLPARGRLTLLDEGGRPTSAVRVPRVGRLRVDSGFVVLDPVRGARGRVSFTYRAASPNGPVASAHAVVDLYPRVIVTGDDRARTARGTAVVIDIAANDHLIVPGAVLACAPQLFARRPRRPDPLPVVRPQGSRPAGNCAPASSTLTTRPGAWLLDGHGRVVFKPAVGFVGTATAYYRQASDNPFDLGVAKMSVSVRGDGAAVLGTKEGAGGARGAGVRGRRSGDRAGALAATGVAALLLALAVCAAILAVIGALMMTAARRRRQDQPADLKA